MRLPLFCVLVTVLLSACSAPDGSTYKDRIAAGNASPDRRDHLRLGPGDLADVGTTAYALWEAGAIEANPIYAPSGDAVPFVAAIAKYGMKHVFVAAGTSTRVANTTMEISGAAAACWNLGVIAGATTGVGLGMAAICGVAYLDYMTKPYVPPVAELSKNSGPMASSKAVSNKR